ncbi:hypothetical protein PSTG_07056 [Puccinia striiformis f. sp. tritici PST-78]|uniref:FAD dependent oxidoreductase domain-containing protein n=1 Tax=Puccinia striiformis f. sp. tritici PST-78 TaxID=1165861 RepID=A0A0L0VL72_9BASI|nr:hypothetical protein PSTG_07056 [Puccinia striiformis f. sp. tritici PST-78]
MKDLGCLSRCFLVLHWLLATGLQSQSCSDEMQRPSTSHSQSGSQKCIHAKDEDWKSELPTLDPIPSRWMKEYRSPLASHGQHERLPDQLVNNVTIIGTGLTGISVALKLIDSLSTAEARDRFNFKDNPFDIVFVEAREFCSGATGRNGGHLTASAILGTKTRSKKFSTEEAIRAVKLEEKSVKDILDLVHKHNWKNQVDLVEGGNVHIFDNYTQQTRQMEELQFAHSVGLDLTGLKWLDKEEAIRAYGLRKSSVGALRLPGNNLFPSKLITKMYEHIQSKAALIDGLNIRLFTHTPVLKVDRPVDSKSHWTIHTSRGTFESNYVIHATNAYASYLLPQFRANSDQTIVPTRAQVIAVQPKSHDPSQIWTNGFSANEGSDYFFQRPTNHSAVQTLAQRNPVVILGGGRNHAPPKFESGIGDDSSVNHQIGQYLRSFLPQWFPKYYTQMDDGDVVHEWSGIMGFTKDHDPIVGQLIENGTKIDGQFISAGYSGHGMSRAPGCAEVVASMIFAELMGKKWTMPDWFPTHYLTTKP